MIKKVCDGIELDVDIGDSELQMFLAEMPSTQKAAGSLRETVLSAASTHILQPSTEYILPSLLSRLLMSLYTSLYGEALGTVSQVCTRSVRISFNAHILSSVKARSEKGTCISASWMTGQSEEKHIGIVQFYFQHNIVVGQQIVQQQMAFVNWLKPHPDRHLLRSPLEVWYDAFLDDSPNSFITLSKIQCPVAFSKSQIHTRFGNETVYITIPLNLMNTGIQS
jgi:hypothetical protein